MSKLSKNAGKKKNLKRMWSLLSAVILISILFVVDMKKIYTDFTVVQIFVRNMEFFENIFDKYNRVLWTAIVIAILLYLGTKYEVSVTKMSVCGAEIKLKNPDIIVLRNVTNFMNTKRSLFFIDPQKDNYYEVFDSYYATYQFLREQMSCFDHGVSAGIYCELNVLITILNQFLTAHQTNYRHWYENLPKEDLAQKDIGKLQKKYRYYQELTSGFLEINEKIREFADKHLIDYSKWCRDDVRFQ